MADPDRPEFARELLAEIFRTHPLRQYPILIWKRFRVTAGMAYYPAWTIALSPIVLQTREQIRETLLHEYAHLMAVERGGVRAAGHGPHWKAAMAELGLAPTVRHRFAAQRNLARQTVTYRCGRCGEMFKRPRRFPRNREYAHIRCGGMLTLIAVIRKEEPA